MNDRINIYVRNVITGVWEYSHGTNKYATLEDAQRCESRAWPTASISVRWAA